MGKHVVVGAGKIGEGTARRLAERGHEVVVVTRRGTPVEGATSVTADASDRRRITEVAEGAQALYNCANPQQYSTWAKVWPPIANALLHAAEDSGAVLVTMNNLYGYGEVSEPMREDTPFRPTSVKGWLRARMWRDAKELNDAGRIRATEARASDYVGGQATSVLETTVLSRIATGRRPIWLGDPDAPHSWTYVDDAAATLVALGTDERAWGKPWHVPTPPPISAREAAVRAAELIGAPRPKLTRIPYPAFWTVGVFNANLRAMREMQYQFTRPFQLDSTVTEQTFGLTPTPTDDALRAATLAYKPAQAPDRNPVR
jgi:nucleoside-diphosphate-sugar epimerase